MVGFGVIQRSALLVNRCPARIKLLGQAERRLSNMASIKFSEGEDAAQLRESLASLLPPSGRWQLCNEGAGIERPFKFKTFKAAWSFMNAVAEQCKKQRHHPEWSNVYSAVYVRWTTHQPQGLSSKDVSMAQACDEMAQRDESTEIMDGSSASDVDNLRSAADRVAGAGADCCTPKKP